MGIITLTDRISVSVRAKNETESNSQKRATGKNIANALGNGNISDSLADQLGNTSKPTIADEQGREWVAMSDIIAAGKKMQQEGAFDKKEVHEGITTSNGTKYGISTGGTNSYGPDTVGVINTYGKNGFIPSSGAFYLISKTADTVSLTMDSPSNGYHYETTVTLNESAGAAIDGVKYSFFMYHIDTRSNIPVYDKDMNGNNLVGNIDLYKNFAGYLFGAVRQSGGSLIDWTKPDDEIEEDIRNLHETWDVSDHAGSVNANGTYVLAGPIEFNPGD